MCKSSSLRKFQAKELSVIPNAVWREPVMDSLLNNARVTNTPAPANAKRDCDTGRCIYFSRSLLNGTRSHPDL